MKLTFAAASAPVLSGCVGGEGDGDEGDGDDGPTTPETAEFGYETWVPAGKYANIGYADLTRLREHGSLEIDSETATVVGEEGPAFADVDAYISTDSGGVSVTPDSEVTNHGGGEGTEDTEGTPTGAFDAYHGSFDAETLTEDIADELSEPEETESNGYTVVRGTKTDEEGEPTGEKLEAVVADSYVISSSTEGAATRVLDAALGDAEREAETEDSGEFIQGLDEYADDPFLVVFHDPTNFNRSKYRFVEVRDGVLTFVNVTEQQDEETAKEVEPEYNDSMKYNDTDPGEENTKTRVEGRNLILIEERSLSEIENFYFAEGGIFP